MTSNLSLIRCTACKKPAKNVCAGCKNCPNENGMIVRTPYCSKECQELDWENHKKACKQCRYFRTLYNLVLTRLADTLQKLFYLFRTSTFDKITRKVEDGKDGNLHMYYEDTPPNTFAAVDPSVFSSERDEHSVLALFACSDAVVMMSDLVRHVFAGPAMDIWEHSVGAKGIDREVIAFQVYPQTMTHRSGAPYIVHQFVSISMIDKSTYALDLAGAQFGWHEPLVELGRYMSERVAFRVEKMVRSGKSRSAMLGDGEKVDSLVVSSYLKDVVLEWEIGNGSVQEMCELPESEFLLKQMNLLEVSKGRIQDFIKELGRKKTK